LRDGQKTLQMPELDARVGEVGIHEHPLCKSARNIIFHNFARYIK
jgi:hypothetical protein